ncbi:MAG TPA: hypothetical protein PKD99_12525 [Sphingopyxis sp.]|nr:hypothetical protein [Sphingopyxis sp.]HMP45924.1 hypothetical protein [Sphingopyxis sp.]HMQ19396.1 hypothetical protein [Sphingopyxis sp.]
MKGDIPVWLFALFPVAFVCLWVVVCGFIAQMGWAKFARRFSSDRPVPDRAQRFLWASLAIGRSFGSANYSNCVNVWIDEQAVYLRPSLPFRAFHPPLRLHWRDVASVEPRRVFLFNMVELQVSQDLPPLLFSGRAGRAISERWRSTGRRNQDCVR